MSRSALQIIAIAESQSSDGQYVLVFEAAGSDKRITVNVGRAEARAIAIYLQQQPTKRPLTHDLLKTVMTAGDLDWQAIVLTDLIDEVYYAQIHLLQANGSLIKIDSRLSDAVALALRCDRPMYILDHLLLEVGIQTSTAYAVANQPKTLQDLSLTQLQKLLEDSVSSEAFTRAAKIRDELNRRTSS